MRPGGGKDKGGNYEREVGYILSEWLSRGLRRDVLCRTVGSGAQFTSSKSMAGIPGDLRSQDPIADKFCSRFVIECKHWRDLEFIRFLAGKGELYTALLKVQREGQDLKKDWLLIAKQNSRPSLIFMPFSAIPATSINRHILFNASVAMFELKEFLENVTPENFV